MNQSLLWLGFACGLTSAFTTASSDHTFSHRISEIIAGWTRPSGASPAWNEMDMHEMDGPSLISFSAGTQAMDAE